VGAEFIRDVEPGELVVVDGTGLHASAFAETDVHRQARCIFEMVYFARPDSTVFGENVHTVRYKYGIRLADEHPVEADVVMAVPDSGNDAALGFSRRSGIPLDFGYMRNHYIGRTFIMPEADKREIGVDMKLSVLPEVVKGKRVVVVDDSIVRGTTARRRVSRLREVGAREIHVRISCPPIRHPCFYGIDFPTSDELVAGHGKAIDEIRRFVGADTLGYLRLEGLFLPFRTSEGFCSACFTGKYPTDVSGICGKESLKCGGMTELDLAL